MSFDPSHPAPVDQRTHLTPDLYGINPFEVMVATQAATQQQLDTTERLLAYLSRLSTPAQLETVVLTAAQPTFESRERFEDPVLSIGIYNPNNINIYFSGIGTASATSRSPSAPPNSLIVLPISAQMIEVAATPSDVATTNAIVFLLRYFTVQPAFLGKGI